MQYIVYFVVDSVFNSNNRKPKNNEWFQQWDTKFQFQHVKSCRWNGADKRDHTCHCELLVDHISIEHYTEHDHNHKHYNDEEYGANKSVNFEVS